MLSKNQLGFLYMFLSICAFSFMDLIVKWTDNYPIGQVMFFRGLLGVSRESAPGPRAILCLQSRSFTAPRSELGVSLARFTRR